MTGAALLEEMLKQPMNEERAREVYTLAVMLFHDVQSGKQPVEAYGTMLRAFEAMAAIGHVDSWIEIGRCRWNGWGTPEDRSTAMEAYRRAAGLGSDYGAFVCATNYYWYYKNYEEAKAFAERALEGGDPDGNVHYLLGLLAYNGQGRPADIDESRRLHSIAAERGDADAMFELYVYDMKGIAGVADPARAIDWLCRAAERKQARACYSLGAHLCAGNGVEKDSKEGLKWYMHASELGHGRASAMVGMMHLLGDGVEANEEKATDWLALAATQGFDVEAFLDEIKGD